MKRTFSMVITGKEFNFRLPVLALKKLSDKHGNAADFVAMAGMEIEKMELLLELAANYTGNTNPTTNGAEILEMLIDDGYGMITSEKALSEVAYRIGAASGVFSQEIAEKAIEELYFEIDGKMQNLREEDRIPLESQTAEDTTG